MKKVMLFLTLFLLEVTTLYSQNSTLIDYPKVGHAIQDHVFNDLDNFPGKKFKLSDFRGKWLIVDFWSRWCGGCIASFPKMNAFHKKFKDKIQLIMVGLQPDSLTKDLYYKLKKRDLLEFTVAFDEVSHDKYDINFLPTIFVVNPEGRIVAKTTSINDEQMTALLTGKMPSFKRSFSAHELPEYDKNMPLLTTGQSANGGVDTSFLFRSMLCKYNYDLPYSLSNTIVDSGSVAVKTGKMEVAKYSLADLYRLAYFGNIYWGRGHWQYGKYCMDLVLDIKDSSCFIADRKTLQGLYAYSLIVPPSRSSAKFLMEVMQGDLNKYFSFDVSVEDRAMPVFHLVIIDKAKALTLKTKGGSPRFISNNGAGMYFGFTETNVSLENLLDRLYAFKRGGKEFLPTINKTGIEYNCDITLNGNIENLASLNKMLGAYGLKIVEGKEIMKTIVVRDKKG